MNEEQFPGVVAAHADGRILANNAAASQIPREAIDAVVRYLTYENAQKGSNFARGVRTNAIVEEARTTFAELLAVDRADIGFGANATSIALDFARTLAHTVRDADRVAVTATDHYANVVPWNWFNQFGAQVDVIDVDDHGDLDEGSFEKALEREPLVVALPWASNATGTVFDIAALAQRCAEAGALVVVDGVQAVPHLPLTMPEHVDFAFFSAYKVFAPHFGVWYARPELRERFFTADERYLPSAPVNWSMETGTQSFEALAGWLGTVEYLRRSGDGSMRAAMERFATYERGFVAAALERFAERRDRIVLYGGPLDRDRLPVFAFNVRGERPAAVAAALEEADIEVAVGDYYTPRLMSALAHDFGSIAVRMSFAHYNTLDELDRCFAVLDRIGTPVRA